MDILRPVANSRKIIMLINRDRSLIFFTWLSSVSRRRRVNSSSSEVRISTVNDSAKKAWSQKLLRVWIKCFANRKFSSGMRSSGRSNTCAICRVIVSINPSVCSASSRYAGDEGPASGPMARIFWTFLRASTLRVGSLLRMLDIVIVILSATSGGDVNSS